MLKAQDCLLGTLYGRYGQQKWMWYIARNSVFEPLCIVKFNMAIVKNYKCKLNLVKLAYFCITNKYYVLRYINFPNLKQANKNKNNMKVTWFESWD